MLRGFGSVGETEAGLRTIPGVHNADHCVEAEARPRAFAEAAGGRAVPEGDPR